jgi:Protein of unknown function (DUF2505)
MARGVTPGQTGQMRFQAEHTFDGPANVVAALLTDPEFYQGLVLPDLSPPDVLQSSSDREHSVLRLRYEFIGSLDPIARRIVGENRLAWIQEVRVEQSSGSGELSFGAAADPARLHGSALFTLKEQQGRCVRRLSGELTVAIPLIGSRAERRIVPGVLRRLDIEADAIAVALAEGAS